MERRVETALNASVGALVIVLLWYIPLSPLLGGGAAGFLQNGDRREGVRIGAVAGAAAPGVVLFVGALAATVAKGELFGNYFLSPAMTAAVAAGAIVYCVGLGALGGWLGVDFGRE